MLFYFNYKGNRALDLRQALIIEDILITLISAVHLLKP